MHFYKHINSYLAVDQVGLQAQQATSSFKEKPAVISVLKRITTSALSETNKFLALGCKDGSIFIYDLVADRLCKSLDRHSNQVSCLGFYKDWVLTSGGLDGKVHMYDISVQDSGPKSLTMAQKNFFTILSKDKHYEDSNQILGISVSPLGLAFAIDKYQNARIYSIFHGRKICKLSSSYNFDNEILGRDEQSETKFKISPRPLIFTDQSKCDPTTVPKLEF